MRRATTARGARGIVVMLVVLLLVSCASKDKRLESMINLEPNAPSADRVKELKAVIEQYGDTVAETIKTSLREADALRLLSQEYVRQEMYGPALDAIEQAIRITPESQVLHYLAGVTAGYLGKAQAADDKRTEYLERAKRSYEIAIRIAPNYIDALYGLAVLEVFELNEPDQAIPRLQHVLELNQSHVSALFVLARAYVALGNIDRAVDAYDRIIKNAPDTESRQRAERFRQLLLGGSS